MIIYMVTRGSYSDYTVMGLYSTRELAEHAMTLRPDKKFDWNDIEELILDSNEKILPTGHEVGKIYVAGIRLDDAKVWHHKETSDARHPEECRIVTWAKPVIFVESPHSFDHAVKVAVEYRQQYLRENS